MSNPLHGLPAFAIGKIRKVHSYIPSSQGFVLYLECGHKRIHELVPDTMLARCLECAAKEDRGAS